MRAQPESAKDSGEDCVAWALCEGCGHWQQAKAGCALCGWPTTTHVDPARVDVGSALRFLVEAEVRSDGSWRIGALRSARLPNLAHDGDILRSLHEGDGPLRHLRMTSNGVFPGHEAWDLFREDVTGLVDALLNARIQTSWPAPRAPSRACALLAVRCLVLNPDISDSDDSLPPWLHVVPFDTAASDAAAALDDDDVVVTCGESVVGLGEGGDLITVAVNAPCELLVESCAVVCESAGETRVVWRSGQAAIAYRDVQLRLPAVRLPANAVRELAAASEAQVQVAVRGRSAPFLGRLAVGALPSQTRVADLLLDLGSTTTKWALHFRDDLHIDEHDEETESLICAWGVQPYRKAEFVADTSGAAWCAWLAQALPALRYWVGRVHGAYLARVVVSLPSTLNLDVESLSTSMLSKNNQRLSLAVGEHLVHGGAVHLEPEHAFLARHYLDVLRVLHDAADAYKSQFHTVQELRAEQKKLLKKWKRRRSERDTYERKSSIGRWWARNWDGEPKEPGTRPSVDGKPTDPDQWMLELQERPDQLDRVALIDAGGLSLDVAVLESGTLFRELSQSFDSCGGEELSLRIGKREAGRPGTRKKAQLGLVWRDTPNPTDRGQREYIEATHALYDPVLRPLVAALDDRWRKSGPCVVILTGGGSRNPHLGELIGGLFAQANLQATVLDGPFLQQMLRRAREFPESLKKLESESITRFELTQAWSERRERQPWARYDKFAVVGGMLASGAEDGE